MAELQTAPDRHGLFHLILEVGVRVEGPVQASSSRELWIRMEEPERTRP